MRGMQQQLGNWGAISASACRNRETKKNLCQKSFADNKSSKTAGVEE